MTLNYVYKKLTEMMKVIENVNMYETNSYATRRLNQKSVNKVYNMIDSLRVEIEREHIKNKQKHNRN